MNAAKTVEHVDRAEKRPRATRDRLNALKARAPDPALAAIAEGRRLLDLADSAFADQAELTTIDPQVQRDAAQEALFTHCRGTLLRIIPTSAAGCASLAQFAVDLRRSQGVPIYEDGHEDAVLLLIAQSPML